MMRHRSTWLLLTALLAPPLHAQIGGRYWPPADRAVITSFVNIVAVAASADRVYAVGSGGVIGLDPRTRAIDGPYEPSDPSILGAATAALVDPLDNSLWIALLDGWAHFDPLSEFWERGSVPGPVTGIAFDQADIGSGLFIRTGPRWYNVPRGSLAALPAGAPHRPLAPPTVEDAIRANPSLLANSAQILLTNRLTTARYTSAAQGFGGMDWYIGTSGAGLLYLRNGDPLPERLTFGLPTAGATALFGAPGGVWVATWRSPQVDAALTFVASDLSRFITFQGVQGFGYSWTQARGLIGQDRSLWAATDAGAARVDAETGNAMLFDETRGLPDRRVLSLNTRRGRIVVGTAHGVARIDDSLRVERLAPDFVNPALAVAQSAAGDTVWVGTAFGLVILVPDDRSAETPSGLAAAPSLRVPVVGLAWKGDTLLALTQQRLAWRDPSTGGWSQGPPLDGFLGNLRVVRADPSGRGLWVGGARGAGLVPNLAGGVQRPLLVPGDVPAEVFDLTLDERYLWLATAGGLVRFRLDAIR